ncbi:MAG: 5'/3'-nucleotidase SurE [Veillonellaceae bacterium]|nr:5'/3'-nucleotidase SurE [Veillonellaceae bacterium]
MHIFMTNDDGIEARGLRWLARELTALGRVTVVAPDRERSSSSSSLSLRQRLYLREIHSGQPNLQLYSFTGSPADCSKFSLGYLLRDDLPDLIVSGMNNGFNLGSDVVYSGTVGAAREGLFAGIPSLAVSGTNFAEEFLERAIPFIKHFVETMYMGQGYRGLLNLNIPNIPAIDWEHVRVCPQGLQQYTNAVDEATDEMGRVYYRVAGSALPDSDRKDDVYYGHRGYITVTALGWKQELPQEEENLRRLIDRRIEK